MTKIITTLPNPPWDDSVTHNLVIRDMTHEEQAKELVEMFRIYISTEKQNDFEYECALIAVNLVIENNMELLESQLNNDFSIMDNSNNWRLIKAEIEKL